MTNVIQVNGDQPIRNRGGELPHGLRDLYVRALKTLSVPDAEVVGEFSLTPLQSGRRTSRSSSPATTSTRSSRRSVDDPDREAVNDSPVRDEVDLMGTDLQRRVPLPQP